MKAHASHLAGGVSSILLEENVYGHRKRLDWIVRHVEKDDRLVELGCGTGAMITGPLLKLGYDVIGVDRDAKSIEYGRRLLEKAGLDPARLAPVDVSAVATPDVVIASEMLEHLTTAELGGVLRLLRELLSPGGRLLVTVPNGYGWFELESALWYRCRLGRLVERARLHTIVREVKRRLGISPDEPPPSTLADSPHLQRFTAKSIAARLEDAGFDVRERTGTVLLAGPFTNLLFGGVGWFQRLNLALGDLMPDFAAGFLLVCTPTTSDAKYRSQEVWGATPAGVAHAPDLDVGTREFFDRARSRRREIEIPFVADLLHPARIRGRRVLEIGCGVGFDAYELGVAGTDYVGVDLTAENPKRTRSHLRHHGLDPAVLQADAERLPIADGSFDMVFSNGVLHHTPDISSAFAEAHRVLRPSGTFVVVLYHRDSAFYWFSIVAVDHLLKRGFRKRDLATRLGMIELSESPVVPHVTVYGRRELRRLLIDRGFEIESLYVRRLLPEDLPGLPRLGHRPWRLIPQRTLDVVGRAVGWYVIAEARRPSGGDPATL